MRALPLKKVAMCVMVLAEPFFSRTRKLPCIFAALFVCYSSRLRLRDSLLRPCYDFLLFFTTQTRPVHRETDSGDEKFITPINKIHNPILGYAISLKKYYRIILSFSCRVLDDRKILDGSKGKTTEEQQSR